MAVKLTAIHNYPYVSVSGSLCCRRAPGLNQCLPQCVQASSQARKWCTSLICVLPHSDNTSHFVWALGMHSSQGEYQLWPLGLGGAVFYVFSLTARLIVCPGVAIQMQVSFGPLIAFFMTVFCQNFFCKEGLVYPGCSDKLSSEILD